MQASSRVAALHLQEDGLGIVLKVNVKRDPEYVNEGKVLSVAHLTASFLLRRHILVNTLHFLCVTSFKIKVNLYFTSKMLLM